jgi:hypothetical protein
MVIVSNFNELWCVFKEAVKITGIGLILVRDMPAFFPVSNNTVGLEGLKGLKGRIDYNNIILLYINSTLCLDGRV